MRNNYCAPDNHARCAELGAELRMLVMRKDGVTTLGRPRPCGCECHAKTPLPGETSSRGAEVKA